MTSQEMMLPWFGVVVEGDMGPDMIAQYRPGGFEGGRLTAPPSLPPAVGRLRVVTPPFAPANMPILEPPSTPVAK
jgi:hypothetical protein